MNEDFPSTELIEIEQKLDELRGLLSVGNDATAQLHDDFSHLSGQIDILNHSIYVANNYQLYTSVALMIIAALLMFLVGYIVTRR